MKIISKYLIFTTDFCIDEKSDKVCSFEGLNDKLNILENNVKGIKEVMLINIR